MKIGIIYGSSRPSNVGEVVANWIQNKADFKGNSVELISLAKLGLPIVPELTPPMMVENGLYKTELIRDWSKKIAGLDAVIFVAAEYNLGYTPILKNSIDVLYHEWVGKRVAFVSYGSYPKSTAVEQLRVVMSAQKTVQVEETVHISPSYEAITDTVDESKVTGELQITIDKLIG